VTPIACYLKVGAPTALILCFVFLCFARISVTFALPEWFKSYSKFMSSAAAVVIVFGIPLFASLVITAIWCYLKRHDY